MGANFSSIKRLINTFRFHRGQASGMFTDTPISQQPQNTYRNAWGISNQSTEEKGGGVYNMAGQDICAKLPAGADIRGQQLLEERDQMVVFLNVGGKSEIGYWSLTTCEYKKVIDDGDIIDCNLDFGTDEWIPIVFKYIRNGTCNEIHLYWSNGGTYKTLNFDRPCAPLKCHEILLFNCKCLPAPSAFTTEKGGYDLEPGAKQYFAQLEDEDHNTTNWFSISNPIYVGSKNNRAGESSKQAVNILVEHLDPDYPYVNLGVIETSGGVPRAKAIAKLGYSPNGVSFFHRSRSQYLYDLTIEEVLVKNPGYIRGFDLFQHDRVLYLFNTKAIREPDMQSRIIDSVRSKYKVGRVPMRKAHLFSGLQHNSVLSFSINYNYCDGRKTRGYHVACFGEMPGAGAGCSECGDDNYKNNSTGTSIDGKPYDNPIEQLGSDYEAFTPTPLGILNNGDFDIPDDNQFIPPDTSGEGNACACWAYDQANKLLGGPNNPLPAADDPDKFEALYNTIKDLCESGCTSAGVQGLVDGGIIPRSDSVDFSTMPTADEISTPDKRFKTIDDFSLNNGEKPGPGEIGGAVGQGGDGNNSDTTNTHHSGSKDYPPTSGSVPVTIKHCEPTIIYADAECCIIKEIIPCIDDEGIPSVYLSCEKYPDEERCCNKGKTYGSLAGERIRHFRMPTIAQQPHFISYHDGVPSAEHRDNHEYNNSFARFLWMEFSGIPLPKDEEIDIPLCPHNPFTIGWEERRGADDVVVASGVLFGTFEGKTLGETLLFPNHGTNSPEHVDRWINDHGSHVGAKGNIPAYTFHSPDTAFDRPPLVVDYMSDDLDLSGRGWLHDLYAEGLDPDSSFIGKKNRKGARSSMNLNKWEAKGNDIRCVKAASYVEAQSVLDKADEFTMSLSNLSRASCVYIETDGGRIDMVDKSFDRDVEKRQGPLEGKARYVTLSKFIPNAYGGITDTVYYPLWQGKSEDFGEDGKATCLVMAGDAFINYWSFKRPSYVSDHVNPQETRGIKPNFEFGGGIRLRWPLKSMLRSLFNTISADCECGTVPKAGNKLRDPRADNDLNGQTAPGGDRYFPQVQTQLISVPVESRVNLGFQGSGDDFAESTYRDLNGQVFDSSFDGGDGDYERAWMDRYYATMCENPKWKCLIRVLVNFLFTYGIGIWLIFKGFVVFTDALIGTEVGFVITIMTIVAIGIALILMVVGYVWIVAWANTDLDNRMIDNLLGITDCFPDKKEKVGGDGDARMKDSRVQGFEDNFYEYNYDFSLTNKIEAILGLPAGFDPCSCPAQTSYPVWHSNPQNPESARDAYKNFKTNGYFDIPTHHGSPQKMFNIGSSVYLQTTDTMFQVSMGQVSAADIYLETSGTFLKYPQLILTPPPEGKGGTRDPNAGELTKWGYVNVDVEARQIYLFTGGSYQAIGDFGMTKFLDNFMEFESTGVRDERSKKGVGYSLGVDNARSILFITKTDGKRGWTLSFDMDNQAWLGFEFFQPLVYAWDRFKMFSLSDGKMWQHNKPGEFSTVYGERVPMILDFVITDKETMDSFKFHNSTVHADFDTWDDMGLVPKEDLFFDHVGAYNTFQSSGLLPVIYQNQTNPPQTTEQNPNLLPVSDIHRGWRFDKIIDKVDTKGKRLFSSWREDFFTDFKADAIGGKQTSENWIDNYMVMRLVFDNEDTSVRVLLKHVITEVNTEML